MTPFFEALSIIDCAAFRLTPPGAPDPSATEDRTSLTIDFILVLTVLLRNRRNSFWRERLTADLWLANVDLLLSQVC